MRRQTGGQARSAGSSPVRGKGVNMNEIINLEKENMKGSFPKEVKIPNGYVVAGGSVRRWFMGEKQISDFDYFTIGKSQESFIDETFKLKYENIINSTYEKDGRIIQVIKKEYNSVEELLNSFDFHHCQFAYDGKKIYTTKLAIISSMRKHLSFNNAIEGFELDTLRRAFKYQRQGYAPCIGTIQRLAEMLSGISKEKIQEMIQMSPSGDKRSIIRFD